MDDSKKPIEPPHQWVIPYKLICGWEKDGSPRLPSAETQLILPYLKDMNSGEEFHFCPKHKHRIGMLTVLALLNIALIIWNAFTLGLKT